MEALKESQLMKEMKTYRVLERERAMNEEIKSMIVDAL